MPIKHLTRFLTLLALLLAPFGMAGGHAATAQTQHSQAQASGGHCADSAKAADEAPGKPGPVKNIDCMMACSCMPPVGAQLVAPPLPVTAPEAAPLDLLSHGLAPQAELPPPRLS